MASMLFLKNYSISSNFCWDN